jgi:hypothetical protein
MTSAIDLLAPHIFYDPVKNAEFIETRFLCSIISHPGYRIENTNAARTLKLALAGLTEGFTRGDPWDSVYLKSGIAGRTPHALLRRDYFDLLVLTASATTTWKLIWTPARICYIAHFYPSHPIPGVTRGLSCKTLDQHDRVSRILSNNLTGKYDFDLQSCCRYLAEMLHGR